MFKTLIVEDSFIFRKLLKEILQARFASMEITEAMDGKEALEEIYSASPPDLIFMDIKLPGRNGLDLAKQIKTKYPGTVIVILTSYDLPEYREAASQSNADYFLAKGSSSKADIFALVDTILSKHRSASA